MKRWKHRKKNTMYLGKKRKHGCSMHASDKKNNPLTIYLNVFFLIKLDMWLELVFNIWYSISPRILMTSFMYKRSSPSLTECIGWKKKRICYNTSKIMSDAFFLFSPRDCGQASGVNERSKKGKMKKKPEFKAIKLIFLLLFSSDVHDIHMCY